MDEAEKFEDYLLANGYVLELAAIDAMGRSEGKDPFFLGKAEGLCLAMSKLSGASIDWVRDHVCNEAF